MLSFRDPKSCRNSLQSFLVECYVADNVESALPGHEPHRILQYY